MRVPSSKGVSLAVHNLGGGGEPILICHATGFCGRAYTALARRLVDRHHVWAVDFRGHGDSTVPADGDFNWEGAGDDVLAAADAIGADRLEVVGHSMGGGAALLAELKRPGLLRWAYLYEPIVLPAEPLTGAPPSPMADNARRRREVFPSKAEALARYASRPPLDVLRAGALADYVEYGFEDLPDGTVRLKCRGESEARTFEAESKVTVDRITGIDVPVVVAIGASNGEWSPAMFASAIVGALPRGRLLTYQHLGHFGPLQDPDSVADDILALDRG